MKPETPTKAELYQRCDRLREENETLWHLASALCKCRNTTCEKCFYRDDLLGGCTLDGILRDMGIEVPDEES